MFIITKNTVEVIFYYLYYSQILNYQLINMYTTNASSLYFFTKYLIITNLFGNFRFFVVFF